MEGDIPLLSRECTLLVSSPPRDVVVGFVFQREHMEVIRGEVTPLPRQSPAWVNWPEGLNIWKETDSKLCTLTTHVCNISIV